MEHRPRSPEERVRDWLVQASEVAPDKRREIIDMLYAGFTIGQTRVALDVSVNVVLGIIIQEMEKEV